MTGLLSEPPTSNALPREVDGFHLLREVGRGGMGVVYEARELASGRTVALKVLLSDFAPSDEELERFRREAYLAAAISHDHCVFVYGAHVVEGAPAISMEFVAGETLEDKIRRGDQIPVLTAVRWTIDLLEGLEAAHTAGVLHRDVKPSNCFITSNGHIKIGDFGLSRTIDRDVQLTRLGQFVGSAPYASPEQIRGRAVDVRSDIYSCGATLYAMLTGRPPHTGSNRDEVLARAVSESPPSPRTLRIDIPRDLERVILRALERDPEKRWQDIQQFHSQLQALAIEQREIATPWKRVGAYFLDYAALVLLFTAVMAPFAPETRPNMPVNGGWDYVGSEYLSPIGVDLLLVLLSFSYFAIGEGMGGSTIGKWIFGIRVLGSTMGEAGVSRALVRSAIFHAPHAGILIVERMLLPSPWWTQILLGCALFVIRFFTARPSNCWRGLHDLASGTLPVPVRQPLLRRVLRKPPVEAAVIQDDSQPSRLGDYAIEGLVGATFSGHILKAFDASLRRSVWIHCPLRNPRLVDDKRRKLSRQTRLRWLGSVETPDGCGDVFESPGGSSLQMFVANNKPLEWPLVRRVLLSLVAELQHSAAEAREFALEQVWIDRSYNMRVLDEPVGQAPYAMLDPLVLVRETAKLLLLGGEGGRLVMPRDLPMHAESLVARLLSTSRAQSDLEELHVALSQAGVGASRVRTQTRVAQLIASMMGLIVIVGIAMLAWSAGSYWDIYYRVELMSRELRYGMIAQDDHAESGQHELDTSARAPQSTLNNEKQLYTGGLLSDGSRRAREILIADAIMSPEDWMAGDKFETADWDVIVGSVERHPRLSDENVAWAQSMLRKESGTTGIRYRGEANRPWREPLAAAALLGVGVCAFFSLPMAVIMRGGLTFSWFGVRIRDRRGRRASRFVCLLRCVLVWLPLVSGTVLLMWSLAWGYSLAFDIILLIDAVLVVSALAYAIVSPTQYVVDRLLGTRLVPV